MTFTLSFDLIKTSAMQSCQKACQKKHRNPLEIVHVPDQPKAICDVQHTVISGKYFHSSIRKSRLLSSAFSDGVAAMAWVSLPRRIVLIVELTNIITSHLLPPISCHMIHCTPDRYLSVCTKLSAGWPSPPSLQLPQVFVIGIISVHKACTVTQY